MRSPAGPSSLVGQQDVGMVQSRGRWRPAQTPEPVGILRNKGRQDLDRHSPPILGEDSRPLPQIGPPATDGRRLETACPYFVPVLFFAVVENSGNHIIIWGGVIRSSCVAERRITRTCAFCSGLWLEAGKLLSQVPQDQPSRL